MSRRFDKEINANVGPPLKEVLTLSMNRQKVDKIIINLPPGTVIELPPQNIPMIIPVSSATNLQSHQGNDDHLFKKPAIPPKRKPRKPTEHDLMELRNKQLTITWAEELNHMEPNQGLLAKKYIFELLFEGRIGTLNRNSVSVAGASSIPNYFLDEGEENSNSVIEDSRPQNDRTYLYMKPSEVPLDLTLEGIAANNTAQLAVTWAIELNSLEGNQSQLAKNFINEILFEGRMGTLTRDSLILAGRTPNTQPLPPIGNILATTSRWSNIVTAQANGNYTYYHEYQTE